MFTGIIEAMGVITDLQSEGTNRLITIRSSISPELHIDQSVSHNGVCLTVIGLKEDTHTIVAVEETLRKSTFRQVAIGDIVNLERALRVGDRLDGHMVQGHVDTTLECIGLEEPGGSYHLKFAFAREYADLIIPKGSICLNGVSLTIADLWEDAFLVAVIPYTWDHTNLHAIRPGEVVNAEFDMIGKYLSRFRELLK